ncbi:LysR family transcriptional regulator [Alcanivorax sp. 24]|uniref:LysR family transcriptional regulator n=1 Tax=Alcanivorax sp. 24 TaxID=2545266 RepID=UPI001F0DE027|nr:LysR family transcriptional regulator [Alcanivorax sp. 24]
MVKRFDLELLNTLVTAVEQGSLSAAVPILCRSQSTLSEQVRKLEQQCGVPLLVRGKQGVVPTPAGERLVDHARKLLALNDTAYQDMQGLLMAGDVRLAITDYFRPDWVPTLLRRIRGRYPRLRLHVAILKSALIEQEVTAREYDLGISMVLPDVVPESFADAGQRRLLRREPLCWVAHSSLELTSSEPVPIVALPASCALHRYTMGMLESHRRPYYIAHSASGVAGMHLALSAGLGVACLNASAVPEGLTRSAGALNLPRLPPVRFHMTSSTPAVSALVAEVRGMLARSAR